MDNLLKDKKALKLFFIITIPVSALLEGVYIAYQNALIMLALMWTPGVAGIITSKVYYKKENALGFRFCKLRYILLGVFIPIGYLLASYTIAWIALKDPTIGMKELAGTLGCPVGFESFPIIYIIIYLISGFISNCLSAAGEELGWRGFMYPALERVLGRNKALILSGVIWSVWHMPLIIAGNYQSDTTLWYGLLTFVISAVLLSIILSWMRMISNSILPAIFIHSSHNLIDQGVFQPLSTNKYIAYFAGEQGFITIIFMLVIVGIIYRKWNQKKSLV